MPRNRENRNPDRRRTYFDMGRDTILMDTGQLVQRAMGRAPRLTGNIMDAFRDASRSMASAARAFQEVSGRVSNLTIRPHSSGETLELGPGEIHVAPFIEPEEAHRFLGENILWGSITEENTLPEISISVQVDERMPEGLAMLVSGARAEEEIPTTEITQEALDALARELPSRFERFEPRLEFHIPEETRRIFTSLEEDNIQDTIFRIMSERMARDLDRSLINLFGVGPRIFKKMVERGKDKYVPDFSAGFNPPYKHGIIRDATMTRGWLWFDHTGQQWAKVVTTFNNLLGEIVLEIMELRGSKVLTLTKVFSDEQVSTQIIPREGLIDYLLFGRRGNKLICYIDPESTKQRNQRVMFSAGREELEDFMTMITLMATGQFTKYEFSAKQKGDEKERVIRAKSTLDALEEDE